jgi:hypothetical protein
MATTDEAPLSSVAAAKAAYGSVWRILGILTAALSLFNLAQAALRLSVPSFLATVLTAYRALFHPLVEFLLLWSPWSLPHWGKDVAVLWLLLAGTVFRWIRAVNLEQAPRHPVLKYLHRTYIIISTLALAPILLVTYIFAKNPHALLRRVYFIRPHRVFFPPVRLLMNLREPPYDKRKDVLTLLFMMLGTLVACVALIGISSFFGSPGTVPGS